MRFRKRDKDQGFYSRKYLRLRMMKGMHEKKTSRKIKASWKASFVPYRDAKTKGCIIEIVRNLSFRMFMTQRRPIGIGLYYGIRKRR